MKKYCLALLLSAAMAVSGMMTCGVCAAETEATEAEEMNVRIGALNGPTAMTLAKLRADAEEGLSSINYEFSDYATEASALVAPMTKGELDIACMPSNLASVIYNNTEGGVVVLATCNNSVLYVVEKGEEVNSVADLAGKTFYMTGQGAVPEYTVRYLLQANGIDADADVTINWCADTTEALSYLEADENAIAILPQPFVTAACAKVEGLRVAVDLNAEWEALDNGCSIITGVVVANKEFAEQNPEVIDAFLAEYEASLNYANEDAEGAAALIEAQGIVAKAPIAMKALPACHLVYMSGEELETSLSGFLQILFEQNPKSVGGNLPAEDFYLK